MPAYESSSFDPPAPVARVVLRDPKTGATSDDVSVLLDTGADVTSKAGVIATPGASYELAGFDGNISLAQSADLDLLFLGKAIRGRYLLYDQDYGILGRDVLNLVSLLMNGPRQAWSGSSDPARSERPSATGRATRTLLRASPGRRRRQGIAASSWDVAVPGTTVGGTRRRRRSSPQMIRGRTAKCTTAARLRSIGRRAEAGGTAATPLLSS